MTYELIPPVAEQNAMKATMDAKMREQRAASLMLEEAVGNLMCELSDSIAGEEIEDEAMVNASWVRDFLIDAYTRVRVAK